MIEMEDKYLEHFDQAEHWLTEASNRATADAGHECLATAAIHAVLALAVAVDRMAHQ
ncbi:hypothetical protein AB0J28_16865 [Streptosporangium canum]|uniref:hypothetical protein n=1 Tax=Streptosporangium canum TaxID=324952 RepID=UPI0034488E56